LHVHDIRLKKIIFLNYVQRKETDRQWTTFAQPLEIENAVNNRDWALESGTAALEHFDDGAIAILANLGRSDDLDEKVARDGARFVLKLLPSDIFSIGWDGLAFAWQV
jgi:hypothetical protein